MNFLTEEQAVAWLKTHGLSDVEGRTSLLIEYAIPTDSGRKTALARLIAALMSEHGEVLFHIRDYGVWPSSENLTLFDGFRHSLGENRSLEAAPAQVFGPHDTSALSALLALVLYFRWGGLLVPQDGRLAVAFSHEEVCHVLQDPDGVLLAQLDSFGMETLE